MNKINGNFKFQTKRLTLRFYRKSDYQEWKRAYSEVFPKKNIWDFGPIPLSDEKKLIAHFDSLIKNQKDQLKSEKGYYFAIFLKKNNQLIGQVSLMDISRGIFNNGYLGYRLLNNYWSMGFGTEILKTIVKFAFHEVSLHRIEAGIEPNNIRSIRLIKKIGFRKEGRSFKRLYVRGEWRDIMIYALTQ